jgi:glycosyltransferase involved in cell wall biosynthesis
MSQPAALSVWATHYGSDAAPTPCAWYRVVLPFGELRQHGWDARYATASRLPPPESEAADVFVLQGGDHPDAAAALTRRRSFQRTVYETDDDYFHIPPQLPEAYAKYSQPGVRAAVAANMRACDMVTVTTETLAEVIRRETGHPDVVAVPNCVPDGVLTMTPFRRPRRTVIGWAGSGNRDQDFAVARDAVRTVLENTPRAEMHFMGTDYRHLLPRGLPARHTHPVAVSLDWRAWFGGYDFDVALAPLADIPFNRSRSPVKAVESFALGIPVLATDLDPYRGVVIDGVNGYLCRTRQDWARRLRELVHDREARQELGAKARETARAHVISTGWRNWDAAYRSLLS